MFSQDAQAEAFVASGDLSACLNRIVTQLSTDFKVGLAGAGAGFGVLQNAPKDGEFASVATDGIVMVRVGAAVSAGDYITSAASGWGVKAVASFGVASGTVVLNAEILGKARTGAASGMLAAVAVDAFTRASSGA
jgi:hypothetical protein